MNVKKKQTRKVSSFIRNQFGWTKKLKTHHLDEFDFLTTFASNIDKLQTLNNHQLGKCFVPKSGSGQLIKICSNHVYKGPPRKWQLKHFVVWDTKRESIKIDFYTMNLLVQTALKHALKQDGPHASKHSIEHWESIVRDESDLWYMKSKKYAFNDTRFKGVSFVVKDGCVYEANLDKNNTNAYNRIFKNSPVVIGLTENGESLTVNCVARKNKLRLTETSESKPLKDGTYTVSKRLLNIEDYLRLSVSTDICTKYKKQLGIEDDTAVNTTHCLIHQGIKWYKQVRGTLQWAYDKIQLHHCDVKAEQFLLDEKGNAVVSDLDKVTFTVCLDKAKKKPVRIRLHRYEMEKGMFMSILLHLSKIDKTISQLLPHPTAMQFEPFPRKNADYECLCYLSSYLLLMGGEQRIDKALYLSIVHEMMDKCIHDSSVYEIDVNRLWSLRNKAWKYRQNYMHAAACVTYSKSFLKLLRAHNIRNTQCSPKWILQQLTNLHTSFNATKKRTNNLTRVISKPKSTVSLSEIKKLLEREWNKKTTT